MLCTALIAVGRDDLAEEVRDRDNSFRKEHALSTRGKHMANTNMAVSMAAWPGPYGGVVLLLNSVPCFMIKH